MRLVPVPRPTGGADRPAPAPPYLAALRRVVHGPGFAYLTLFFLQLKVVWGAWRHRDLTAGDTAWYYRFALAWHDHAGVHLAWSPLYTAFYGTLLHLTPDPFAATLLHRLLIVFAASLLVLAFLRQLLPPPVAWLTAAWWVLLPITFDTLYEVHLFAVLPVLAAWVVAGHRPAAWTRGLCLGVLAAATLLVRNELFLACGLWALVCLVWEWRSRPGASWKTRLAAYGLPLAAAAAAVLFFYWRSDVKLPELRTEAMRTKHTLNMAQVYCFGHKQRHPEWDRSPWTQYHELMTAHFGKELPTLPEMVAANPRAVLDHVLWNVGLTPSGVQVLLFNATSGNGNPDYVPVATGSRTALALTVAVLLVWAAGLILLWKERHYWWAFWLRPRAAGWLAVLCVAAVALLVIPTQRPRPSYLFPVGLGLMALTGTCLFVVCHRVRLLSPLARVVPVLMVALPLLAPCHYRADAAGPRQPVAEHVRRLGPFAPLLARPDAHLLGPRAAEVAAYVGRGACQASDANMLKEWPAGVPLDEFLEARGVNLLYLDETLLGMLETEKADRARPFLDAAAAGRWRLVGMGDEPNGQWRLFRRTEPSP